MTNTHPSIARMRKLQGSSAHILQQARDSAKDFAGFYGDPAKDLVALKQAGMSAGLDLFRQADYKTTTSGIMNRIFGRSVWFQQNALAPVWSSLPKSQRSKSSYLGWRAKTDFADTGRGGQAEGTIPTAVVGTYVQVSPSPKESSLQMRVSGLHQDMYEIDDAALGTLAELQGEIAIEHMKTLERALTTDVDTGSGVNIESIDRISASSANQAAIGWTVGDEDIFGIDRSANTWANGQQDAAATARTLTTKLMDSIFRRSVARGGNPTYWVMGYDTWEAVSDLFEGRARFDMKVGSISNGHTQEDAKAVEGMDMATFAGQYQGRPMIASDQIVADSGELSRLYLHDVSNPEGLDKPRLGIDIIHPTQVFLAGERTNGAPQSINFAGDSVFVVTRAELGCRYFGVQGQVRDTTAP